jgi:hypothetical protein
VSPGPGEGERSLLLRRGGLVPGSEGLGSGTGSPTEPTGTRGGSVGLSPDSTDPETGGVRGVSFVVGA